MVPSMKLSEFPNDRWLDGQIGDISDVIDKLEDNCSPDDSFATVSSLDEQTRNKVSMFTRHFYMSNIGDPSRVSPKIIDEPFYFALATATLIQGEGATLIVPDPPSMDALGHESTALPNAETLVEGYLKRCYRLDSLLKAYTDRLSGGHDFDDKELPEVQYARLMGGATFLLIDIANATAYGQDLRKSDLEELERMEQYFQP